LLITCSPDVSIPILLDWWTGIDPKTGSKGLFPSNYVELMQGGDVEEDDVPPPPPAPPAAAAPSGKGKTAIAQYE